MVFLSEATKVEDDCRTKDGEKAGIGMSSIKFVDTCTGGIGVSSKSSVLPFKVVNK
jgi:hypothetical protein